MDGTSVYDRLLTEKHRSSFSAVCLPVLFEILHILEVWESKTRVDARAGRLKAQVETIEPRVEKMNFYELQKILFFFINANFAA